MLQSYMEVFTDSHNGEITQVILYNNCTVKVHCTFILPFYHVHIVNRSGSIPRCLGVT